MSNQLILISGCQRSGSTLLHLILDSHPDINGIDETDFDITKLSSYLTDIIFHPYVSIKLPTTSHTLLNINSCYETKFLWCIRNPKDVVSSMISLNLPFVGRSIINWALHPDGAQHEIINCIPLIASLVTGELNSHITRFKNICETPVYKRSHDDAVFTAAFCWRIKCEILYFYMDMNLDIKPAVYENIVYHPKESLIDILDFCCLDWHDNLLKHHKLHDGMSIGNTRNTRPIDTGSMNKWEKSLDEKDIEVINDLCSVFYKDFGYSD